MKKLVPGKLYTNAKIASYWILRKNTIYCVGAKLRTEGELNHLIFLKITKNNKYQFLYKSTICELVEGCCDSFLRSWK